MCHNTAGVLPGVGPVCCGLRVTWSQCRRGVGHCGYVWRVTSDIADVVTEAWERVA